MGGTPEPVPGADTPGGACAAGPSVSIKGHVMWPLAFSGPAALCLMLRQASTRHRCAPAIQRSTALATPNYGYEKRQRELAKKRKAEEKKQKKLHGGPSGPGDAGSHEPAAESPAAPEAPPPAAS
ncbi:hypothetical protein AQPW35_40510 [Rubrivivax pictus]|uniref:Uncharacterized protein n=1 Tax=Pseudaquabacterium pictum TaxID=2315236 RepID=A0A480AVN0_9BURK|nr:hypothetical protein AQPW35_40510 [Rubrivivax pictus]